jgi:4-diphosphocytidyl-2-C-methyl-D-erythritol kinase
MGGGSADAAAALRLAGFASGLGDERLLRELGAGLGADVPAQISPGCWLAGGAGEQLKRLPEPGFLATLLVLPVDAELATAAVYAEADRLDLGRAPDELAERRRELLAAWSVPAQGRRALEPRVGELFRNDLQDAALALCPEIADALSLAREAGADVALVTGSGPTVVGVFLGDPGRTADPARAGEAARAGWLAERVPAPTYARPVAAGFGRPAGLLDVQAP